MKNRLSIIIPTYNEEESIRFLIDDLKKLQEDETNQIIVVDGGSTDQTVKKVLDSDSVIIQHSVKGRAAQMNAGACAATGDILFFLHADTVPPLHFDSLIRKTVNSVGSWGCFRLKFDHRHPVLQFIAWFTRFNFSFYRFGDQGLFLNRALFNKAGKYDSQQIIFEDLGLAERLSKTHKPKVIHEPVVTSARKFLKNGVYKMTLLYLILWFMYECRFPQTRLLSVYKKHIRQDKI